VSAWKIYAWNKATKEWGLVGEAPNEGAAELAIRTINQRQVVAKAVTDGQEMRGAPLYFYRIKYLSSGDPDEA
jgi:hypothetical protein